MLRTIAVIAAALPLLAPATLGQPPVDLASQPPPEQVEVEVKVITVSRTNCAPGNVTSWITPDNRQLMLAYGAFSIGIGTAASATPGRTTCQVALKVMAPTGYTYGIVQADYTAEIYLPNGDTGALRNNFYFQGFSPTEFWSYRFAGPADTIWRHEEPMPIESVLWAPCGERRSLNVNTELQWTPSSSGPWDEAVHIGVDYAPWAYHLAWKQCAQEAADPDHRAAGGA